MNYADKQIEEIISKYPQALKLLRSLESIDRLRGEEWDSMREKDLAKLNEIVKVIEELRLFKGNLSIEMKDINGNKFTYK